MTPLISFAITTHNEGEYIRDLLDQLVPHCEQTGDEIVSSLCEDLVELTEHSNKSEARYVSYVIAFGIKF